MNGRDITQLGYPEGPTVGLALRISKRAKKHMSQAEILKTLAALRDAPEQWASDPVWGSDNKSDSAAETGTWGY